MTSDKTPANTWLDLLLKKAVSPQMKRAAFRKTGTNYHRRRGSTVQIVNIQSSSSSLSDEKAFYINAGISFDSVCVLVGEEILERPKASQCDSRGFRGRLERFVSDAPESWILRSSRDAVTAANALEVFVGRLLSDFDRIDGLESYRIHPWFERFYQSPLSAQILYLLGELDAAKQVVVDLTRYFAHRQNANRMDWWIHKLGLKGLEAGRV